MDSLRPFKRQKKTLLACAPCRSKKIKCNGVRPVCGACLKNGRTESQCVWKRIDGKEATVAQSEQIVRALQNRIKELEQTQEPSVAVVSSPSMPMADETVSVAATSQIEGDEPRTANHRGTGVSALVAAVTGEPQYEGFQGPSSVATFMSSIRQAVEGDALSPDASFVVGLPPQHPTPSRTLLAQRQATARDYVLPPRRVAESLLRSYWVFIHPLYPILNQSTFTQSYEALWTGRALPIAPSAVMVVDEATVVCILNLVLALSCQYSDEIARGQAFETAEVFFARARGLFQFDTLDSTDQGLPDLQIMLLIAQYLQTTGRAYKAWNIIAVAIRDCHRMGFHLASTSSDERLSNPIERQMMRRIYHFCIMSERILCMTLGRPIMVSLVESDSVPLPLDIDDDRLHPLPDHTSGRAGIINRSEEASPSILSFLIESAKLYRIVHQILSMTHIEDHEQGSERTGGYSGNLQAVLKFDDQLVALRDKIPSHLRRVKTCMPELEHMDEESIIFHRQSVVLYLRHLQARIFLFRPVLVRFCSSNSHFHAQRAGLHDLGSTPITETLTYRTALQCSFLCVKIARRLIDVLYEVFATGQGWGAKPNWLYGVLHIYLSATVLIAARLRHVIRLGEISESELEDSWQRALKILETFQSDSLSAQRCVTALKRLHQKLMGKMEHAPTNSQDSGGATTMAGGHRGSAAANHHTATSGARDDDSQADPFWALAGAADGGTSGYQGHLGAEGAEDLAAMLDLSWVNFAPEFPDMLQESYWTVL